MLTALTTFSWFYLDVSKSGKVADNYSWGPGQPVLQWVWSYPELLLSQEGKKRQLMSWATWLLKFTETKILILKAQSGSSIPIQMFQLPQIWRGWKTNVHRNIYLCHKTSSVQYIKVKLAGRYKMDLKTQDKK